MRTEETTTGPIQCHNCKQPTPISTRLFVPVTCKCGTQHAVVGLIVASGSDIVLGPVASQAATSGAQIQGQASGGMTLTVTK